MMDYLTRRYDVLQLAKSKLVDNSALFATLKSKNLGNPAIEECLRKLHENQNISEGTTKPFKSELLSDVIKNIEKNLDLNNRELGLLRERINKVITFDPEDNEDVITEAKNKAKIWHKHKEEYRKTLNIIYEKNKKERKKRIQDLIKKNTRAKINTLKPKIKSPKLEICPRVPHPDTALKISKTLNW